MLAERSWVVCLVEPPDIWMSRLEQQMTKVEARATFNQLRLVNERQYVDKNFGEVNKALTSLTHHVKIVEKITKNWNRM